MRYGIIPMLLLLAVGQLAAQSAATRHIPGVCPKDVYYTLDEHGMTLSEHRAQGMFYTKLCMDFGGIDYRIEIMGPDNHTVSLVRAEVCADSTRTDVLNCQQFFRIVAATPYTNSDPGSVEKWITDRFCNCESRKVIGPVEYVMRAPSDYRREMTMRVVK